MTQPSQIQSLPIDELNAFFSDLPLPGVGDTKQAYSSPTVPTTLLEPFFADLADHLRVYANLKRERDETLAGDFSVFRFIKPDENRLSDLFSFFLNPAETHGQGALFLRLFVQRMGKTADEGLDRARVTREALTYLIEKNRRKIDVLVIAPPGGLVVGIENKVGAAEGLMQLDDYRRHLERLCCADYCLIFLTPSGRRPQSLSTGIEEPMRAGGHLLLWSYHNQIREWLTECRLQCKAERIRYLLEDFIAYIDCKIPKLVDL